MHVLPVEVEDSRWSLLLCVITAILTLGEMQSKGTEVIPKRVRPVKREAKYLQSLSTLLPLAGGKQACLACSATRDKLPSPVR